MEKERRISHTSNGKWYGLNISFCKTVTETNFFFPSFISLTLPRDHHAIFSSFFPRNWNLVFLLIKLGIILDKLMTHFGKFCFLWLVRGESLSVCKAFREYSETSYTNRLKVKNNRTQSSYPLLLLHATYVATSLRVYGFFPLL